MVFMIEWSCLVWMVFVIGGNEGVVGRERHASEAGQSAVFQASHCIAPVL
jgi:hypothetical protein